ncbi:MAG: hypothetical protein CVU24_02715 [Betaproteobacteria bacterium HGW-Betaproteobacteria-18]|nr:MAG: hypothetical protein CVU24_02715 [Betaproteobacteria bacterium HGW-Betaproteobacteria-18]
MRNFLSLTAALLLSACASTPPPPPEWQSQAFAALTSYTAAYLSGNTRVADVEFERAKTEIARTGRPDLMARIELVRCAVQVASLVITPCEGYRNLAQDAAPVEQTYASFIAGRWAALDAAQLPMHYRALVAQTQAQARLDANSAPEITTPSQSKLNQIEDPLARLVATGALFQREPLSTADINQSVETASAQGWRRPLLAWLGVQLKRIQTAGNADAAAGVQRRIDLVSQTK